MKAWFRDVESTDWFAYLPVPILETLVDDAAFLDLLLATSGVTTKASSLKAMSVEEKRRAVKTIVESHKNQPGAVTHGLHELEILAVLLGQATAAAKMPAKYVKMLWPSVKKEADLLAPVAAHYRTEKYEVYREIPMGRKRVDILCHKPAGFLRAEHLIAIELKNSLAELKRGIDQLTTFADYAHSVYLACTPALAVEFLTDHASARGVHKWDPKALENKLSRAGIGLLIVRENDVFEVARARASKLKEEKRAELTAHMIPKNIV